MRDQIEILVADDHPFIRRIVVEVLKDMQDARLIEAHDGQEALVEMGAVLDCPLPEDGSFPDRETISQTARGLACLITDFNMPKVNGLQLLRMIRTGLTGVPRNLPVILLTGFQDTHLVATALKLDVNAFITKPVSKDVLTKRILEALTTPWKLKSIDAYAEIVIPPSDLDIEESRKNVWQSAQSSDAHESRDGAQSISALREGQVLDEDIRGKNGALLVAKGTELDAFMIKRLNEIKDIVGLDQVHCVA